MKETSFIAQHIFCKGIQSKVDVLKVDINKKLLSYVWGAHAEYSHALEENKKAKIAGKKQKQESRMLDQ